jgi:hypothetical protein
MKIRNNSLSLTQLGPIESLPLSHNVAKIPPGAVVDVHEDLIKLHMNNPAFEARFALKELEVIEDDQEAPLSPSTVLTGAPATPPES